MKKSTALSIIGISLFSFFAGYVSNLSTQPDTLPAITTAIDVQQARLEARITGLVRYCIAGSQLLRSKPGCEELAAYVTQQADAAEREANRPTIVTESPGE